jgi:hypothetical protein
LGAKGGDKQDALATLTQRFTEKAVLLQQGSTYRGNYGVPQLLEQLIGKENVSENMFQKFAVYRDLPIFQSVFRDMEAEIGKTGAFSADRIRLVFQLLDEALPNEVIQAHKNSMAGFLEATRSAFLDPEVGLFGLGRKIQGMEMAMVDQYGNFLDKQGKVAKSWEEAEKEQISLYESITKTLTGFGLPLSELASILPRLFEPFANLINPLQNTFKVAQSFYRNFNIYTKEFEDLAKSYSDRGLKQQAGLMKRTAGARGSLLAIANLLTAFGDMSGGQFDKISQQLQTVGKDPKAEMAKIGNIASEILKTLFNSQFIEDLGFQIGLMVGGILQTVAQALGFAKEGAESSRIVKGLKTGFEAAGGITAFRDIINNFFSLLFKFLKDIFMAAPAQFAAIGAGALVFPAITSALSVALGNLIERFIDVNLGGAAAKRAGFFDRARQLYKLDKAKATSGFGGGSSKPTTRTGAPKSAAFRAIPDTRIVNPQFPQVALGMRKGVGGVTGPYRAPKVPKPKEGLQGFKWLQKWLGNAITGNGDYTGAPKTKDLGKNLKIAGKGLKVQIVSVSKNAFSNAKGFLGGVPGKLGAGGLKGLKNPIGMLGKFGTALTAVTGILSGVTRFFETGDIWKSLGAVAGPIIGNILGFAIAGPLGAFIGGWIMSQTQVTDKIGEVFRQVADNMAYVGESLAATGNDLIKFVQSLTGAETETQAFQQLLAGINIILFPLTATFNALALAAGLIRIAVLEVIMFVDKYFQGGKRQKELAADYLEANRSLIRLTAAIDEQYAKISRRKGDTAILGGKEVTWSGTEWVGADGKPVKGGKPPASATPPVPGIPNPPSSPAAAGAASAAPKEIAQTAANTQELNQKASTQITQAASIRVAAQQTQKNTTVSNTTLGNIRSGIMAVSNRIGMLQAAMLRDLNNIEAGVASISSLLSSGQLKVQGAGPGNGPMGTATGNLGRAQNLASQYGLSLTSYFRAGDKGYHGLGRAMDFSNGVSTPQQMEFAQAMVAQYGTSLKELIYTPLGFGIKDGVRVPLSYWGPGTNLGHYDHVHVAFANGPQDGRMFTQMGGPYGAQSWERSMVPGSVKVASITGNSGEGFGGETSVVNNFTITQRDGEDGEALANRVATLFYEAMEKTNASIFG